jgi:hypothetical protein
MSEAMRLLEEAIEVARREGYAEGYAAAVEAMREFVAKTATAFPTKAPQTPRATGRGSIRRIPSGESDYTPVERGANANLVEAALRSVSPRAIGPTEIQHIVTRDAGKEIAYSSVRHALNQLEARHVAKETTAKRWQYISQDERQGGDVESEAPDSGMPGASKGNGALPLQP